MTKNKLFDEKLIVTNKVQLIELIKKEIEFHGNKCSLNHIDVSRIKDLSYVLSSSIYGLGVAFEGDVSDWDVSNVEDMRAIFLFCNFSQDLSKWKPLKMKLFHKGMAFLYFKGEIPYWAKYKNIDSRITAIFNYMLAEKNYLNKQTKL